MHTKAMCRKIRGTKITVPKPCSRPLRQNPFETYRDPITGQWKVRYPASALPAKACSVQSVLPQSVPPQNVQTETVSVHPLWQKSSSDTKVA